MNKRYSDSGPLNCSLGTISWALVFVMALVALILSAILYSKWKANELNNEHGPLETIELENGTVITLGTNLILDGISGIEIETNGSDTIVINDLRDLSPYVVCPEEHGCEFTHPIDAYNKVVADNATGATIIILAGIYDFGDDLFLVDIAPITFRGTNDLPTGNTGVIFTASGPNGGIQVKYNGSLSQSLHQVVTFQGITLGEPGSDIGFVFNITQGESLLHFCSVANSNLRIYVGNSDTVAIITLDNCAIFPLPPNDFITTLDATAVVTLKSCYIIQLNFSAESESVAVCENRFGCIEQWRFLRQSFGSVFIQDVSNGGCVINGYAGFAEVLIMGGTFALNNYVCFLRGPAPGLTGGTGLVGKDFLVVSVGNTAETNFYVQSGSCDHMIQDAELLMSGSLVYQNQNSTDDDEHTLTFLTSVIQTENPTFFVEDNVINIANTNSIVLDNCMLQVTNDDLLISIHNVISPNVIDITVGGCQITTTAPVNGTFIEGPDPSIATITFGNSVCMNQATIITGFTTNYLIPLGG